ncbi:B-box zinc finger protein 22 [Raphanus sativus]|uniref:B-box zinc finger protein 22-like n=1 Tax=Raphanus sativus TaxID=3726 RepID=A0A6J0MBS2_RAPSA|nr:B-box zinc finger protein 22-like [Raphanus sativus]KAJ4909098.1 B-box zinc finger protein 22 [Raphanus sativus]
MKIQCNVCEAAEAAVLCCADEAALCWGCDEKIHAANKLAEKHQRVPLSVSSSSIPKCDICQEASGFFFCLQDRAILCRKCDVAIHTVNPHVSAHQRFLLTGIRVGLEAIDTGPSVKSSSPPASNDDKAMETKQFTLPTSEPQKMDFDHHHHQKKMVLPETKVSDHISTKLPFASSGSATGQWQLEEIFGLTDFDQSYEYMENNGSSKADTSRLGDSDSSSMMRSGEEDGEDNNNCLGGETSCAVPQIHSPPTASGLNWPKHFDHNSVFVPDISSSTPCTGSSPNQRVGKRRRRRF